MTNNKYIRSHFDHYVYFKNLKDRSFAYLLCFNDKLITLKSEVEIEEPKAQLRNLFEMKDLRESKKITGIETKRDKV